MAQRVTKKQAEKVRAAVKRQFAAWLNPASEWGEPKLYPGSHEGMSDRYWVIIWEEGPFEWAIKAFNESVDEEVFELARDAGMDRRKAVEVAMVELPPRPTDVFVEPVNGHTLGIYPVQSWDSFPARYLGYAERDKAAKGDSPSSSPSGR
jgi:hypothetical protein